MSAGHVCFSHGQESGPWGSKISALAEIARGCNWQVESLDYRGMHDPVERAGRLEAHCRTLDGPPVLVGSSMGGFVSVAAAARVPARGLFLMAPALYLPGYEERLPASPPECPIRIVHGWRDDVVPFAGSIRYAEMARANLLLVDADHRLTAKLDMLAAYFEGLLRELDAARG